MRLGPGGAPGGWGQAGRLGPRRAGGQAGSALADRAYDLRVIFPNVPWRGQLEPHQTAFSTDKARRLLGYEPAYSWRLGE